MQYILDGSKIDAALKQYPNIARHLSKSQRFAGVAKHFPQAVVEDRLIYRYLANYEDMAELLGELEFALANGCTHPTLLKTRARKSQSSTVAELVGTVFFLHRGYGVRTFDDAKGNPRVPDFLVSRGSTPILSVEVYQPRDREGLDLFQEDLMNHLRHMDMPGDFLADIKFSDFFSAKKKRPVQPFDLKGFAEKYGNDQVRSAKIARIGHRLRDLLGSGAAEVKTTFMDSAVNCRGTVRLFGIKPSEGVVPRRGSMMTGPGHSWTPGELFAHLVEVGIAKKLRRGQAGNSGGYRALFVDISKLSYKDDFRDGDCIRMYGRLLDHSIDPDKYVYDALLFFHRSEGSLKFPLGRFRSMETQESIVSILSEPPTR